MVLTLRQQADSHESDDQLVEGLRARAEDAFMLLLRRYHRAALRIAGAYVKSDAAAEEVVQEAWIAVLHGIDGFEGRSAFKTWLFRIVANGAKKRSVLDARSVPFSALAGAGDADEPSVDPGRFNPGTEDARWAGHWESPPSAWNEPEERFLSAETRAVIGRAIEALPPAQRQVITLRDVQECTSEETCEILEITEANQRVLLHRARSKVRQALELHLGGAP
jgi:RNA polymerase sigma-70 factor (ECF subfamily)